MSVSLSSQFSVMLYIAKFYASVGIYFSSLSRDSIGFFFKSLQAINVQFFSGCSIMTNLENFTALCLQMAKGAMSREAF